MMKTIHLIHLMVLSCSALLFAEPKEKQTQNPAIVFMVAGQSNAGGCGIYSPEMHKELGRDKKRPLVPGTTAAEIGLPTDAAAYRHSYIWMPDTGFERLDPMTNTRPTDRGSKMHGMELPVAHQLEKRFPDNDIYIVKHGPSGRNLHHDWSPGRDGGHYSKWLNSSKKALAQLGKEYPEVRIVGLYWDQGESDTGYAENYAENLANFIAKFRKDSGLTGLKFFIRKHIYRGGAMDKIIAAQEAVVAKDKRCFLLDIELESVEKNFATWSYSPNNIHLNSKAFVELTRILLEDVLKNPDLGSFDLYKVMPVHAPPLGFQFTLENPEDEALVVMGKKSLEVKIKCPRGIGRGRLSHHADVEGWPEQVVLLIRLDDGKPLKALEGFSLKGEKLAYQNGRAKDDTGIKVEKAEAGMKIMIPGNLLDGESEVAVQWIDFYRH